MGKIAVVFPGQGAQHPGMGLSLSQQSPAARAVFDEIDRLRPGTSALCFSGTAEQLEETQNAQPCLFACELAAARALEAAGIVPDMTAGFSLGELAALTFSGVVSLASGFGLVVRRGELMQADAEKQATTMAAVVKMETAALEALCKQFSQVYPVNYNAPGQITVSCPKEALAPFSEAVRAAGGRAMPLKVAAGFHSPFFHDAACKFELELAQYKLAAPQMPLYSNYTGLPYDENIRTLLSRQICSPVRWEAIVRGMIAAGADVFIEAGPGKVLAGLIKKIDPSVRIFSVAEAADLDFVKKGAEFR